MPVISINTDTLSTETLINICNNLSTEIDQPALGYEKQTKQVGWLFCKLCTVIEERGIDLAGFVICPHAEGTWETVGGEIVN